MLTRQGSLDAPIGTAAATVMAGPEEEASAREAAVPAPQVLNE
jgi:hypothetical protein